jgi:hypothetical protein
MRIFVDDLAIFERARLGFVGVADEINRLAALAIHETPLEAARKTRATATAQTGGHDFLTKLFLRRLRFAIGERLGLERECLFQVVVAAVTQVAFDVRRVTGFIGVLQYQFVFLRHNSVDSYQIFSSLLRPILPDGVTVAQQTLNLFV